jgi:hypothetical protein
LHIATPQRRLEGLDCLSGTLTRLDASQNRLTRIHGVAALTKLSQLNLRQNNLTEVASLELSGQLAPLKCLRTLLLCDVFNAHAPAQDGTTAALDGNACCSEPGYKSQVLEALPWLSNLDGERQPRTCTYAAAARQLAKWQVAPPGPPDWPLPDVQPFLDLEVTAAALSPHDGMVEGVSGPAATELEAAAKGLVRRDKRKGWEGGSITSVGRLIRGAVYRHCFSALQHHTMPRMSQERVLEDCQALMDRMASDIRAARAVVKDMKPL